MLQEAIMPEKEKTMNVKVYQFEPVSFHSQDKCKLIFTVNTSDIFF